MNLSPRKEADATRSACIDDGFARAGTCESCGVNLGVGWHYVGCAYCNLGLNRLRCTLPARHAGPHSWDPDRDDLPMVAS